MITPAIMGAIGRRAASWSANASTLSPYDSKLLHVWKAEDNANDSAGSNNLTAIGTPGYTTGKNNKCWSFNGTDQAFSGSVPYDSTKDFLISFWVNATAVPSTRKPFSANNASVTSVELAYTTGPNLRITGYDGSLKETSVAASLATWYNVIIARRGTSLRFYVGGSNVGNHTIGTLAVPDRFRIGCAAFPDNTTFFDGLVDEFYVWQDLAWTSQADMDNLATALYNSGTGAFRI